MQINEYIDKYIYIENKLYHLVYAIECGFLPFSAFLPHLFQRQRADHAI